MIIDKFVFLITVQANNDARSVDVNREYQWMLNKGVAPLLEYDVTAAHNSEI